MLYNYQWQFRKLANLKNTKLKCMSSIDCNLNKHMYMKTSGREYTNIMTVILTR